MVKIPLQNLHPLLHAFPGAERLQAAGFANGNIMQRWCKMCELVNPKSWDIMGPGLANSAYKDQVESLLYRSALQAH